MFCLITTRIIHIPLRIRFSPSFEVNDRREQNITTKLFGLPYHCFEMYTHIFLVLLMVFLRSTDFLKFSTIYICTTSPPTELQKFSTLTGVTRTLFIMNRITRAFTHNPSVLNLELHSSSFVLLYILEKLQLQLRKFIWKYNF